MTEIIKQITVDLSRKSHTRAIFARQNDNLGRRLLITLTDNGKEYFVLPETVVTISVLLPNGTSAAYAAEVTRDGKVSFAPASQFLSTAGEMKCSVSLYDSNGLKLTSSSFYIDVEGELHSGEDITENEDYSLLTALLAECSEFKSNESSRIVAENTRKANETKRQENEAKRKANEEERIINASNYTNAEKERASNEAARQTKENYRTLMENNRISSESSRSTEEKRRAAAETTRVANEAARVESENKRLKLIGSFEDALDELTELHDNLVSEHSIILSTAYPVGSVYMSTESTSPASLFGGTWTQLKDRFLLGAGDTYVAGGTGGVVSHSHSASSMYADMFIMKSTAENRSKGIIGMKVKKLSNWSNDYNYTLQDNKTLDRGEYGSGIISTQYGVNVGGDTTSGSNLPPYLAVYMWKRIA